jgi:hypothetical protein
MPNKDASGARSPRKFYFMLTFWGAEFREHFYSLLLPTLLAPGNIPVLKDRPDSKLIICTTNDDWDALKGRPLMRQLAEYVEPLPLFIGYPGEDVSPQLHMSSGHQMAARRAYDDGAVAGFLAPDLLCSDGLIKLAVEFIESGKKAVVCPALRFNMEKALKRINDAGLLKAGQPAALPAPFLGSVAANSLHPEILRYDFDGPEFDDYPIWSFWQVPERDGLILYTVSWALLLADYAAIPRFVDDTLKNDTIDSQYAWRNFGHFRATDQVALLNDSSQGAFISLTPENAFDFTFHNGRARSVNALFDSLGLGRIKRAAEISKFYNDPNLDPWRKWLYSVPIILHGDTVDSNYQQCLLRSRRLMNSALKNREGWRNVAVATVFKTREGWQNPVVAIVFSATQRASRLTFTVLHFARRALHIFSFGLFYYPGSSGRNLRAVLRRLSTKWLG